MNLDETKISSYAENIKDLPNQPSAAGISAAALKAFFDGRTDKEVKDKHNLLVDKLKEGGIEGFAGHTEDYGNPHRVTKGQIGLDRPDWHQDDQLSPAYILNKPQSRAGAIDEAVDLRHNHHNAGALAKVTEIGSGQAFLANDGLYKVVTAYGDLLGLDMATITLKIDPGEWHGSIPPYTCVKQEIPISSTATVIVGGGANPLKNDEFARCCIGAEISGEGEITLYAAEDKPKISVDVVLGYTKIAQGGGLKVILAADEATAVSQSLADPANIYYWVVS